MIIYFLISIAAFIIGYFISEKQNIDNIRNRIESYIKLENERQRLQKLIEEKEDKIRYYKYRNDSDWDLIWRLIDNKPEITRDDFIKYQDTIYQITSIGLSVNLNNDMKNTLMIDCIQSTNRGEQ